MIEAHTDKKNSFPFDVKLLIKLHVHVLKVYLAKYPLSRSLVRRRVRVNYFFNIDDLALSLPLSLFLSVSLVRASSKSIHLAVACGQDRFDTQCGEVRTAAGRRQYLPRRGPYANSRKDC